MNLRIQIDKVVIDGSRSDYNAFPFSNNTNKANLFIFEIKLLEKPTYRTMQKL